MEPILVDKERLKQITDLIVEIAAGNFEAKLEVSSQKDDLDAIITGINMIGQELRHSLVSKDYLNRVYQSIIDMIMIMDKDYSLVEVNDAVVNTLGYTYEFLEGKPFSLLYNESYQPIVESVKEKLNESERAYNIELNFTTNLGKEIPVSCSASLLKNAHEETTGVLLVAKDITSLKQTQQELIAKNKELNEFSHKVSHDIKSPLNTMLSVTQLVNDNTSEQELREYFNYIQQMAQQLKGTVDDMLSSSENADSGIRHEKISFEYLIDELKQFHLNNPLKESQNIFKLTLTNNLQIPFYSNYNILYQIFNNLIENAIKYRDPGKKEGSYLNIVVEEKEESVIIRLQDNGLGIPRAQQDAVFEKHTRGHEEGYGSGMGLHYVKTNIMKLGGNISLYSQPGEGTSFIIKLPKTH